MQYPVMTEKRADAISKGIFLIGLGLLFILNSWWPSILLVILASLGVKYMLLQKYWEFTIASLIFLFLFIIAFFHLQEVYLVPALLILGGTYFIVREYFFDRGDGDKTDGL